MRVYICAKLFPLN